MTPEEMVGRLLYRDGLMLVIDKPAGFAVHKGPKGGESLEDHFDALRFGLPRAPALAHRLDRDTSGCLVLGRHRKALAELGRLFKLGRVGKTYWAVVEGGPAQDEGRIELPLGRMDATRGWWMKHDPQGQPATTVWQVMGRAELHGASTGQSPGEGPGHMVPSPTEPGLARVPQNSAQVGQARLAAGEGQGGGKQAPLPPITPSPPLPRRKSGLPDLRSMARNPGKPGFHREREPTVQAARQATPRTKAQRQFTPSPGWRSSR